ncbi:MAG: 30S ribosomal protein S12 methylthiotransferase RimO [Spirochaetes bacterium]|nr:30S ribosomal protein S12 methylthiotransferase RimO [Spirochaetota bacterium]
MSSKSRPSTESLGAFFLESLGCAKNQVDSELMIAALERAGWSLAPDAEGAAVLIVNTCGFISSAKSESIETGLGLKARYPGKKVYMVGCLTERYRESLAVDMPEIDGFLGNQDPAGVAALVGEAPAASRERRSSSGAPRRASRLYERTHLLSFPGSAYVKVAEGCGNRCTYCAIPLIRGDLKSRPREEVLEEIRGLAARGIREVILIAQDLGSYGADRAAGSVLAGSAGLPGLLEGIRAIEGDFWVRMLYIHPDHFPNEIIAQAAADTRLLPYFDLPFQHASPPILSAMGRRGEPERNLELVRRIRAELPNAVIRSTVLVGFPGETEGDVERLLDFQHEAALDWLGVFAYSREEDTPAYAMGRRVAKAEAERRKARVELAQVPITERALDRYIGRTLEALIEEPFPGDELSLGRAYLQAPDVDGLLVVHGSHAPGSVVPVRITRRNGVDLEGEVARGRAHV